MTAKILENKQSISSGLVEVNPCNKDHLTILARLHTDLLEFGVSAHFGQLFVREICYGIHLRDNLMKAAIYMFEDHPAGFIAFTADPATFYRHGIYKHPTYSLKMLLQSLLQSPVRFYYLIKILNTVSFKCSSKNFTREPCGESLCFGVYPQYLTPEFIQDTGLKIAETLVSHAANSLRNTGLKKMRMSIDSHNKKALFFYHRLGAKFNKNGKNLVVDGWLDL